MSVTFRILGPLEATRDFTPIDLGAAKQRALLALLVLSRGEVVAVDRLLDELWGEAPPPSAPHALQVYVSNLRKLFDPDRGLIETRRPGYVLTALPQDVDAIRFEALAAEGRAALETGNAARASETLREALALWRGPALADFAYEPFAQPEAARFEELRLGVLEMRLEADLALGRYADVAAETEALVERHPLRERMWELRMRALYRSGRQAEALGAYERLRSRLSEDLGIDPSPEIRELERAILRQDDSLLAVPPAPQPQEPAVVPVTLPGERRVVTVLSADLVSSTPLGERLDPEDYRLVVAGAVERMCAAVEEFDGTVTHRPGDGVVAIFGWPAAHEDDAERAVRAALTVTESIEVYGDEVARAWDVPAIEVRVGVNTGPIVSSPTDDLTLGDTLNTAARIGSVAPVNRVLVDAGTRRLVEGLFEWEDAAPFELRGKQDPVFASVVRAARAHHATTRGIEGAEAAFIGRSPPT